MKFDLKSLKRLYNKAIKQGLDVSNIMGDKAPGDIKGGAIKSTIKQLARLIERADIVKESKEITQRMRERVAQNKQLKQVKQNIKNDKFLKDHPQFKKVFESDKRFNKSGDAELTAKNYMQARKERLFKELVEQFDPSDSFKEKLRRQIFTNEFSIELIEGMEQIGQHLIQNKESDPDDIQMEFGIYQNPGDEYINRVLNRYLRLRYGQIKKRR